jgi:hypothetical protein
VAPRYWRKRTQATYRTWLERYERWCAETGADPDAVASVAAYIEHLVGKGYGVSAVRQAVSALRLKFRSRGVELEDPELALLLRKVRRTLGTAPRRAKRPFTLEMLERVQWRPGFAGIRDRALLLVGFYGALRIRELVGLNIEDVTEHERGFIVTIWRSKTDQEGRGRFVAIPRGGRLGPAEALEAWLDRPAGAWLHIGTPLPAGSAGERVPGADPRPDSAKRRQVLRCAARIRPEGVFGAQLAGGLCDIGSAAGCTRGRHCHTDGASERRSPAQLHPSGNDLGTQCCRLACLIRCMCNSKGSSNAQTLCSAYQP